MKQEDGWPKPYAASFAINKPCFRQSSAFDEPVVAFQLTTIIQNFFQFFYYKKKTMLSGVTLLVGIHADV